jgi:aldose 1-epimerase
MGADMAVTREAFGINQFGEAVELFALTNGNGVRVRIMDHGGTIVSLEVPDRQGRVADVVLGHDTAEEYVHDTPYFGAAVGRFANRICGGKFSLGGTEYTLAKNNGPNVLHGGLRGFDKRVWDTDVLEDRNAIRMTYISADGEEGFPGEVETGMTYTLTEANELKMDYTAESTRATPYNITNHSYFNLAGHDAGSIEGHLLTLNADSFLPVDATAIPYGSQAPVEGSPFDFRSPRPVGAGIEADHEQIRFGNGYDHNFCLNQPEPGALGFCGRAEDPLSGRVMDVYTTEPGVQFYTGNFLDGTLKGKGGCLYVRRGGFCLETQHYPDSPNQPQFPDTLLRPGSVFRSQTVYAFPK